MGYLKQAKVYRGGTSSPYRRHETSQVYLTRFGEACRLSFTISSKGGGTTEIYVDIGPDDFREVATMMTLADRLSGTNALSAVLAEALAKQRDIEENIRKRAHQEVVEFAENKYDDAPFDDNSLEELVKIRVQRLVSEMHEPPPADDAADEAA